LIKVKEQFWLIFPGYSERIQVFEGAAEDAAGAENEADESVSEDL
jgi:hypothetical protein